MATNSNRPKVLRVALVLGDEPVEEKIVKDGVVTVGKAQANTFCVPLETLPQSWTVLKLIKGRFYLRVNKHMDGRIATDTSRSMLAELRKTAQRDGDAYLIPLSGKSWGKIELDEMKLLFQFIDEPLPQPKPRLPAAVRGTFADRIDMVLATALAISIIVHGVVVAVAHFHETPERTGEPDFIMANARDIVAPVQEVVIDNPIIPDQDTNTGEEDKVAKGDENKDKPKKVTSDTSEKKDKGPGAGGDRETRDEKLDAELNTFLEGLSVDGDGEDGTGAGFMKKSPGGDLSAQASEIRKQGGKVEVGGKARIRGTGEDGKLGTSSGPDVGIDKEGPSSAGKKDKETVPKGRVKVSGKSGDESTSLSPDGVVRKINTAYIGGLRRCYNKELQINPSATGKVTIGFLVNESGRTTRAKASGVSDSLSTCIKNRMRSWRFPPPKDSEGDETDAAFQVTLALSRG